MYPYKVKRVEFEDTDVENDDKENRPTFAIKVRKAPRSVPASMINGVIEDSPGPAPTLSPPVIQKPSSNNEGKRVLSENIGDQEGGTKKGGEKVARRVKRQKSRPLPDSSPSPPRVKGKGKGSRARPKVAAPARKWIDFDAYLSSSPPLPTLDEIVKINAAKSKKLGLNKPPVANSVGKPIPVKHKEQETIELPDSQAKVALKRFDPVIDRAVSSTSSFIDLTELYSDD